MNDELYAIHYKIALEAGIEKSCGNKIKYSTFEKALKASEKMNLKDTTRNQLEPYPCPFCNKWHIGKKIELNKV